MKALSALGLISLLAICITFSYAKQASTTGFGRPPGQLISCSSDNMRRNYCAADVRAGVQLVKQRSEAVR